MLEYLPSGPSTSGPNPAGEAHAGRAGSITVWVVEDNATFRRTMANMLSRVEGIACAATYPDAGSALAALRQTPPPNVILLDIEMPGLTGLEALAHIRKLAPATRVIMLTVFADEDKIAQAISAGAAGYLLKTSSLVQVCDGIREVRAGGATLTPRVAKTVFEMFGRLTRPQKDYGLTLRERGVLELMVGGMLKKEIADRLGISFHTVDTHLRNIYEKLGVNTRSAAVAKALKERLFS